MPASATASVTTRPSARPALESAAPAASVLVLFALLAVAALAALAPRAARAEEFRARRVADGRESALARIAPDLARHALVAVGESHDNPVHHRGQLAVLRALSPVQPKLAVGLEMIQARDQRALDDWVAGKLSENAMIDVFERNWSPIWPLYRDIFLFCREHRIPMIGCNVPQEITRKVAVSGFESLSPGEVGQLPPIACVVDPDYERFLRSALGGHAAPDSPRGDPQVFAHFCEAQLVWDTALAQHSIAWLRAHPGGTVALLCGSVHAWKKAAISRFAQLAPDLSAVSILPHIPGAIDAESMTVEDCDYILMGAE